MWSVVLEFEFGYIRCIRSFVHKTTLPTDEHCQAEAFGFLQLVSRDPSLAKDLGQIPQM